MRQGTDADDIDLPLGRILCLLHRVCVGRWVGGWVGGRAGGQADGLLKGIQDLDSC